MDHQNIEYSSSNTNNHDSFANYYGYAKSYIVQNIMTSLKKSMGYYLMISSDCSTKKKRSKKSVFPWKFVKYVDKATVFTIYDDEVFVLNDNYIEVTGIKDDQ